MGVLTVLRHSEGIDVALPAQLEEDVIRGRIGFFYETVDGISYVFYAGRLGEFDVAVGLKEDSYLLNKLAFRANILAFIVAASSLVALFVSYLVTAKILSPVQLLAELVEKTDPEKRTDSKMADFFPNDEIGYLASAFDRFTERIRDSIIREKEFVSDAGHELRTPLTVIRTSAEIVLASKGISEKSEQKLKNILAAADKWNV